MDEGANGCRESIGALVMISETQLNQLCLQGESFYVDYKREQYTFIGGSDDQKAELLKEDRKSTR